MINQYMRPSTYEDAVWLSDRLRPEDVEEVGALGFTPSEALQAGLSTGPCYTLVGPDGLPCAMTGVSQGQHIWLLGTPGIVTHSRTFLRYSKPALERVFQESGAELLHNVTYANNHVHHRWLRWLGFVFLRRVTINNHSFIEFAKLRS